MSTLSFTGKRWCLPENTNALNASHVLVRLFAERGITDDLSLIPPSVYPDMQRATERIRNAVAANERIGIFGDYDCDGVTSAAQLVRYFRRQGTEPVVRLPHRVHDGYGLSIDIAKECIEQKIDLLITCDTGIASVEEIALLHSHMDVIVTDHHHLHTELPNAYAIIHPALSKHPEPHPSGAGVVFSLISALEDGRWNGMEEDIALAMFGTVADLVELRGGNRSLTVLGLRALENITGGPIGELRERSRSRDGRMTATDIAFRIAPRINAAGRMAEPDIALRALLDGGDAITELDRLNEIRQDSTRALLEQALAECDTSTSLLMSVSGDYPHGIVGLIAGKLTEAYGKPSLVAFTDGRTCTASLRSPSAYNVAEGLARCGDLLTGFGGHAQAAGCTFDAKHIDALREKLTRDVCAHTEADELVPTLSIDAVLDATDITVSFCEKLAKLAPFGQGNPEPLFLIRNVSLQDARPCGGDQTHLQARISGVKSIGFGMAKFVSSATKFDVVARVGIDTWNGRKEPQIFMQDLAATHVTSDVAMKN